MEPLNFKIKMLINKITHALIVLHFRIAFALLFSFFKTIRTSTIFKQKNKQNILRPEFALFALFDGVVI